MSSAQESAVRTPRRILIAGVSGSGKSTLAARLAEVTGIEHHEIDALFHGRGWVPRPDFLEDVQRLAEHECWITEWQYHQARPILLDRADTLVWLDVPIALTMARVIRRTMRRRIRREELWNGNTERALSTFFTDRDHIVRWACRTRHKTSGLMHGIERPGLVVVRLRRRHDVDAWVQAVGASIAPPNRRLRDA